MTTKTMPHNPLPTNHHTFNGKQRPALPLPLSPKQKITLALPAPLVERLRNAVYWTGHRSLVSLIEVAIEELVTEMEAINQEPFPHRLAPLKRGRRQGKRQLGPPALTPRRQEQVLPGKSNEDKQNLPHNVTGDMLQSLYALALTLDAWQSSNALQPDERTHPSFHHTITQLKHTIREIRGLMNETGSPT
ncbi:MAG: hypothetical protein OEV08_09415 [Nitrospira sp.]|nr:hypothetical protein [Nitrospira sp.]